MLRTASFLCGLICLLTGSAIAQEPGDSGSALPDPPRLSTGTPYPEKSPARIAEERRWELVIERAKFRAEQRLARQEWRKWAGYEPLRPVVTGVAPYRIIYPQRHYVYYLPVAVE